MATRIMEASNGQDIELHPVQSFSLQESGNPVNPVEPEVSPTNSVNMEIEQQSLPPADGGKAAWLFLAGCSLIQAPVWGIA